jgi:hypothetical protein
VTAPTPDDDVDVDAGAGTSPSAEGTPLTTDDEAQRNDTPAEPDTEAS